MKIFLYIVLLVWLITLGSMFFYKPELDFIDEAPKWLDHSFVYLIISIFGLIIAWILHIVISNIKIKVSQEVLDLIVKDKK